MDPAVCAATFALGVPMGFVGFAGASLVSVLLIVAFHVPVHLAFGTALGSVFATVLAGGWSHFRQGNVAPLPAFQMALTGVVGAYLGGTLALATAAAQLKSIVGVVLLINALVMYLRLRQPQLYEKPAEALGPRREPRRELVGYGTIGFCCGLLSGFLGIGAIPWVQAGLLIMRTLELNRIIGTAMFAMTLTSLSGAVRFAQGGQMDPGLLASVVLGMCAGSYLGAKLTRRAPGWLVRAGLISAPLLAGALMLVAPTIE